MVKTIRKISGYKLVKTETDEKGNTKHIYEPVTTKHVDRNGNPIQEQQQKKEQKILRIFQDTE